MLVLQMTHRDKLAYEVCFPGGDEDLQKEISKIATTHGHRLERKTGIAVRIVDCFFERPLRRFIPTTSFGNLSTCQPPEVRATARVVQRDIALAIAHWEADRQKEITEPESPPVVVQPSTAPSTPVIGPHDNEFREIDHPYDTHFEEREDSL